MYGLGGLSEQRRNYSESEHRDNKLHLVLGATYRISSKNSAEIN